MLQTSAQILRQQFSKIFEKGLSVCVVVILSGASGSVSAQSGGWQRMTQNWVFGQNVHVSWMNGVANASTLPIASLEGSSTISDTATGALLFYADGVTVSNTSGGMLANGDSILGGWSSTQGTLILPDLRADKRYIMFTAGDQSNIVSPSFKIHMAFIDMNVNSGAGAVTQKQIFVLDSASEKLNAVLHCDGVSWWVITHARDTTLFYAYQVDGNGIEKVVVSNVGKMPTGIKPIQGGWFGLGMVKFSQSGRYLAMANPEIRQLELFDFDVRTGVVSNGSVLGTDQLFYGAAFSPNERFLYSTSWGHGSVMQYDLNNADVAGSSQFLGFIPGTGANTYYGGIQRALDGRIYITAGDQLLFIRNPDLYSTSSGYSQTGITLLPGTNTLLGLPNYPDCIFSSMSPSCFVPIPRFQVDSLYCITQCANIVNQSFNADTTWWELTGDTTTIVEGPTPPTICLNRPGKVTITQFVENSVTRDSMSITVTWVKPAPLIVSADTALCLPGYVNLTASGADEYSWQPAGLVEDPTSNVTRAYVTGSQTFTVTGITRGVCSLQQTVNVTFNQAPITYYGRCVPVEALTGENITFHIERNQIKTAKDFILHVLYPNKILRPLSILKGVELSRGIVDADRSEIVLQVDGLTDTIASIECASLLAAATGRIEANVTGTVGCDTYEFTPADVNLEGCFERGRPVIIGNSEIQIVRVAPNAGNLVVSVKVTKGIVPVIQLFSPLGELLSSQFVRTGTEQFDVTQEFQVWTAPFQPIPMWFVRVSHGTASTVEGYIFP